MYQLPVMKSETPTVIWVISGSAASLAGLVGDLLEDADEDGDDEGDDDDHDDERQAEDDRRVHQRRA